MPNKLDQDVSVVPVSAFSTSYDGGEHRFNYPGLNPNTSYILDGDEVIILDSQVDAIAAMDRILMEKHLQTIEDRVLLLSYGSNLNPGALRRKFTKFGTPAQHKDLQVIPQIFVDLEGHDVVWHGRPGQKGSYFAELYKDEMTLDTVVRVGITALSEAQLLVMHTTEGSTYGLTQISTMQIGDRLKPVFAYVARDASILLDEDGCPIAVDGISRKQSNLQTMTAREAVQMTLKLPDVTRVIGEHTPEAYYDASDAMTLLEKQARQKVVQKAMGAHSMIYQYPAPTKYSVGRSMFGDELADSHQSTGPQLVRMPEMIGGELAPSQEQINQMCQKVQEKFPQMSPEEVYVTARKSIDPVYAVRRQAHDELAARLNSQRLEV